jgi:hypothetical protein
VEVQLDALALGCGPQSRVHVRVGLDGDEGGPGLEVAEVGTRAGAELDDPLGEVGEDTALAGAEVPLEVWGHQAEERGVEPAAHGVRLEHDRGREGHGGIDHGRS